MSSEGKEVHAYAQQQANHVRAMAAALSGRVRLVNRTKMRASRSYVVRMRDDGTKEKVFGQPWSQCQEKARRVRQWQNFLATHPERF